MAKNKINNPVLEKDESQQIKQEMKGGTPVVDKNKNDFKNDASQVGQSIQARPDEELWSKKDLHPDAPADQLEDSRFDQPMPDSFIPEGAQTSAENINQDYQGEMPERQGKESIWQQRSPRTPRDHQHPHDHKGHQGHHREKGSGADLSGELTYDEKVIQKIIGLALCEIPGLLTVDGGFFSNMAEKLVNTDNVSAGIEAEVGKKQVAVDMDVVVEYGYDIENIFSDMKDLIRDEVKQMTHLDVIEVNVNVVDIKTREEYQKDADTIQDKMGRAAEKTGDFAGRQTDKAKRSINRGADKARESQRPRVE